MENERKSLVKIAPSGKTTINGRDMAINNIKAYLDDPENVELPQRQKDILERVMTLKGYILNGKTETTALRLLCEEYSISIDTARSDLKIMNETLISSKLPFEIRRERAVNLALECIEAARLEGDLKQYNAALANLIKADGLEREQADLPFEKLEPTIFILALPPSVQAALDKAYPIENGRIDLNNIAEINTKTIDAEYTELSD